MNQQKYQEKVKRIDDAIAVKEPDRVPVIPSVGTYVVTHAGHTMAQAMYDVSLVEDGTRKFLHEYDPDANYGHMALFCGMGPIFDKVGLQFLQWAGQEGSVCTENSIHQYVEREYLTDEEYPRFLADPSGWIISRYLPQTFRVMEPMKNLNFSPMYGFGGILSLVQFADPAVEKMFQTLGEAGRDILQIMGRNAAFDAEMEQEGYPAFICTQTFAPFDSLSDCLRGTLGSLADLYENPEFVHAAIKHFYPEALYGTLAQAEHSNGKVVFIPLHKGLDGFMSNEQYKEFYWTSLRELCENLIAAGQTPYLVTEGKYDSRLEFLKELPAGKCIVKFENSDMARVKRELGRQICISGGFDYRILHTGTPETVKEEVKKILDIMAPGGGYIFDVTCTLEHGAKPENVAAMFDAVRQLGVY